MTRRIGSITAPEPIAVVGSSCRFPGGASSPSKLWHLLKNPKDLLADIPNSRLGLGAFYHEDGEHHGSTNVVPKAYLLHEDPRLFDAPFFNINPMEADSCDPQHRLLMESVYECMESAGYSLESMQGSATSVYVGCMTNDYHDIQGRDLETINRYHGTGSAESILSNRISYFFDLRGPSVTINTACSSSLVALHFAVQSLRSGESTAAIVGGVNLIFDSAAYISESKLHMLSPTSRSSMWDSGADGYARGEGVSALMVKTLSQALADGDHIECIVRETGMNQDGRTTGMTMPSGDAQACLIRETYARAGLDLGLKSDRPQYFEAHGTGTLAGDPQEARGIYNAFFQQTSDVHTGQDEDPSDEKLFCGSIKTIIGHLEGCAGLAGLLKASLAVQHGIIPPNLLFNNLNPEIMPYYHRLQVPTQALEWPTGSSPRRASVNSFGFGGANCHAIVEEYIATSSTPATTDQPAPNGRDFFAGPLLLSASTGPSLTASINALADVLEHDRSNLDDLAFFTQIRRTTFQQRIWFPGGSRRELIECLRNATASPVESKDLGVRAPVKLKWTTPGVLGVFTGQGAQWPTMGRDMLIQCYRFRESLEASEAALGSLPDGPSWSLVQELCREQSESRIHEAALSQPICTAVQIALVEILTSAGIKFRGVVGHSSGEIAALFAAGILSAKDAMRVAYYRGLHAHLACGEHGQPGAMLAVGLGIDDAEIFCQTFAGRICVAASNSPTSTTLSGDEDAILEAKGLLEAEGKFARLLKVNTAYHSHHMLPCARPYLQSLRSCDIKIRRPNDDCIWISSVHGHAEILDYPEDLTALADEYWVANMCQPVLFSEAVECSLWRAGPFDMVVEVGAHPALKGPATQTIAAALGDNASLPYAATLQRGYNDVAAFSSALGSLWTTIGTFVDFNGWRRAYLGNDAAPVTPVCKALPRYSWSHDQIYWRESRVGRRYRLAERAPHELLGRRVADDGDSEMRWRNIIKVSELEWTRGHVFGGAILFPTVGYIAMAIEAAAEIAGGIQRIRSVEVHDVTIPRALVLEDDHDGVEAVFSVRRRPTSDDTAIEADFAFYSSVKNAPLEKNCSGRLHIDLRATDPESSDEDCTPLLPSRCAPRSGTTSIEGEAYYQAILNTTGLNYTGLFRGLKHIRRTLGFSTSKASWSTEDVGHKYLIHPGCFDVALQAILAAFVNPTRVPIRGSFLPSALSRLIFDPHASTLSDDGQEVILETDCFLTTNTARSVEGDIHVFGPSGQCLFQAHGFRMDNWTEPNAAEDRPVFSRLEYRPDIFYANAQNLPELVPDEKELLLIEAVNRAAFFYLRTYFSNALESEIAGWTWDRQAFCKAAKQVIQQTLEGTHPTTHPSWAQDTEALMQEYKQNPEFKDSVDLKAIHVAGEHLSKVMAREERCLEVYLRENVWAPLYTHSRYQIRLNRTVADLISTFAHRFPRAKYLEVGAGSAGTTIGVLEQLGDALSQYSFTDVSAGFFEKARERLAHTQAAANDRVAYKILDLERDPLEQGFEAQSQDVVIAANVLHATTDLTKAVQNVRCLLKPGGYLVMLEVTGEYLEGLLLMGPLEGWWLGNREGTASQPGLTLQGWDDLFQATGFSGVDRYQSDVPDATRHAVSVVVTQATDARVDILREPLEHLDDLPVCDQVLIIGGQSLALSKTVRSISQHISRFAGRVQVVSSIDKLDPAIHLTGPTAVIALCDVEKPFFADPVNQGRWRNLQALFTHATHMLWVTTGYLDEQDPSAAMMIGLCRTLVYELEQLNLQFLHVAAKAARQIDTRTIVEAFVRLRLGASDDFRACPVVWDIEPELTLTGEGETLIPRLKPDQERNDRVNAGARRITKAVHGPDMNGRKYTALTYGNTIHLNEHAPWTPPAKLQKMESEPDNITIRTTLTITLPHSTSTVLSVGIDVNSNSPVLAIASEHSSLVSVPRASALYSGTTTPCTAERLRTWAHLILARHILGIIASRSSSQESKVIIHGASAALAHALRQLAKGQSNLAFTQSTAGSKSSSANVIYLHPRSSSYILRRSLPPRIGYVVILKEDDGVADKLMSMFPGHKIDLDALSSNLDLLQIAASEHSIDQVLAADQSVPGIENTAPLPVSHLPGSSGSLLAYPSVIDWSPENALPLQVTVKPIDGHGLLHAHKSYLMVGLVSTLGRSICRWMIENGARHIALASRSANVDSLWLAEMEQLGANVKLYKLDVSDKLSVQTTVSRVRAEMPPIAGVANAALVLRDRSFVDMTAEELNDVLAPKVDGSLHLHEEFSEPGLDFFILFSTLSSLIGNAGQSNYDAASLYQVMLAKHRRQRGLPASVMAVGAVADVGYVAERGQSLFDKLSRIMKLALCETDVHSIFAEAIAASPAREGEIVDSTTAELVTGMGFYNYSANDPIETRPPWFNNRLASHFVREEQALAAVVGGADGDHLTVATRLQSATSEAEAASILTQALAARVEAMLQMASGSFKVDVSLLEMGIDSLLAVELRTWFLKTVYVDVPVLKILGGDSGQAICAFAASQYLAEKSKSQAEQPSAAVDTAAQTEDLKLERTASASASSSDGKHTPSEESDSVEDTGMLTSASSVTIESHEEDGGKLGDTSRPAAVRSTVPMTPAQARLWVADRMSSNCTQNNNSITYEVHGFIHIARLRRAVGTVVAQHPGLHTCFFQDDTNRPMQGRLEIPPDCFLHISASESRDKTEIVKEVQDELRTRKWALPQGDVLKVVLISHADSDHTLVVGYHHIALDGTSWASFFRDLHLAYQGIALQAPGKSLMDFASVSSGDTADDFWRQHLSPAPETFPLLPFATTKARPPLDEYANHSSLVQIDGSVVERINSASRSVGVTPVNFYLAAVQCLLSRLADVEDICVGVTDSGRDAETAETIGFFINMLPLRLRTTNLKSFEELLQQVNKTYREARAHSTVPFDAILDNVDVGRDPTKTPLFQVGFDLRPGQTVDKIPLGNCQMTIRDSLDSALPYDICFCVVPMPTSGPSFLQVLTRADVYSPEATTLLAQMFITLLENAVQASAMKSPLTNLSIYPANGVSKALEYGLLEQEEFAGWSSTITEQLDQVCQKSSTITAIRDVVGALSYAELSQAVMSLAVRLLPHRQRRIAVLCEPQREWMIGMLATFRVGAACISLDATLPASRLAAMIKECAPSVVLCHVATKTLAHQIVVDSESAAEVLALEDTPTTSERVDNLEDPSKASLVFCTSGSTGTPKAIVLPSRGFLNYLANMAKLHNVREGEVVLQQSNLGFDMATAQALLALANGGTLVIAPQASRGDPIALTDLMAQERVSVTFGCPTEYSMWLHSDHSPENLSRMSSWRLAIYGGEKCPEGFRKAMHSVGHSLDLIEAYGPTEVSVIATIQRKGERPAVDPLTPAATSIGRPLFNVGVLILDANGRVCPPGIPGEVHVAGTSIALGYLDAETTAKSFTENVKIDDGSGNSLPLGRMYKTGDRGVWRADGTLGFLERMSDDTVVKLRGIRIDLKDVEHAILSQGSHLVAEAVVTMHQQDDDKFLASHVVPVRRNSAPSSGANEEATQEADDTLEMRLQEFVQQLDLPRHMRPSRVVVLAKMPINANGKLDRRKLASTPLPPRRFGATLPETAREPNVASITNTTQIELHLLWGRVLGRTDIPRRSDVDFWAMGGSSLSLVKLQAAICRDMLVELSIRDMFMHSTLGSMANLVSSRSSSSPANQPIDWDQETSLTEDLRKRLRAAGCSEIAAKSVVPGKEILLTGADGFLGGQILRVLLRNASVQRVHCVAVPSSTTLPMAADPRLVVHHGSLYQHNLGLTDETIASLAERVDCIIAAGSQGHCLNHYASLRQPNVTSTKVLATLAARRRIPLHFISSGRVTLYHQGAQAALPPISLRDFAPNDDGSAGFTASKWASEVFLERVAEEAARHGGALPITIHRPCALIGSDAPSEDALNAILKYSDIMSAVPQVSRLRISGYFDFTPIEDVASGVVETALDADPPSRLLFRHYSGGVQVGVKDFKTHMERVYGKAFAELELEAWLEEAMGLGLEPLVATYLRAAVGSGEEICFPFMGTPGSRGVLRGLRVSVEGI
ncbi:Hybrid NRPS-PK synthetase [Teratosphaeria destructans]|uniref:Hybrid NRPS-PK synthetase n=1 Tax=Teratosphaeria destructans TaxID=418781 RepID=A0A9W7SIE1_9PEZI|nr:Hybrid NRPS-PK synthetase [Teratosphaeria destructans]